MADRLCQVCGRKANGNRVLPFCDRCGPRHCYRCGVPLPKGRSNPECKAHAREAQLRQWQRPNRHCSCGTPLPAGYRNTECAPCNRQAQQLRHAYLRARSDPQCRDCGTPIPGRSSLRCLPCDRKRRLAKPLKPCSRCGNWKAHKLSSWCPACVRMYANWRHAYHRGDPVARSLGTIRPYHHWQKKNLAP